jgi:hypothetical protein
MYVYLLTLLFLACQHTILKHWRKYHPKTIMGHVRRKSSLGYVNIMNCFIEDIVP